jgi:hypothetical protein
MVTFAPHITRSPMVIADAHPITVPLNPQPLPISIAAFSRSVEIVQGRLIPARLDHLLDRN